MRSNQDDIRSEIFITETELNDYARNGYIRLGKVAADREIEALCERINEIMRGDIRYDNMLMQPCPSVGGNEDTATQNSICGRTNGQAVLR